jgi:hypothetical protein
MTERWDLRDDDTLLEVLTLALAAGDDAGGTDASPPPEAVSAALLAFQMGSVDEELATLVLDSFLDEPVLVRHDGHAARQLSYATPNLSLDLELQLGTGLVLGAVAPASPAAIEIEMADATAHATADELGRFRVELPTGWCRIRVRTADATLVTPVIVR